MEAVYYINNIKYTVSDKVSVDRDYKKVQELVDVDEEYRDRMIAAEVKIVVKTGNKQLAVVYMDKDSEISDAVTLMCTDRWAMLILWYSIWKETKVRRVQVVPHRKEDIKMYVSIATGDSLRRYHEGMKGYIVVNVDTLKGKMIDWVYKCLQ